MIDVGAESHEVLSLIHDTESNPDIGFPRSCRGHQSYVRTAGHWEGRDWVTGYAREVVAPPCVLPKRRIDHIAADLRCESTGHRLIVQEHVVSAAGSTNAAAVQCGADKLIQVARIFDVVPD